MPYTLTQEQVKSITDLEVAFATTRLLPDWDDIPKEFQHNWNDAEANIYTKLSDSLFYGGEHPKGDVKFNEGFEDIAAEPHLLQRCITAHMRSFEPKHEHKIAGIAYMISKITTITPSKE